MQIKTPTALAGAILFSSTLSVTAQTEREAHAHEHGHGKLNIAIEGKSVAMELEVPGADIVGFEHAAKSDEDKAKVDAALKTLSAPLKMFVVPEAAGCEQSAANVELEQDGEHNEFHAKYAMTCSAPENINKITFAFFEAFPNSKELEVQVVSEKGQMAQEVERDKPDLALKAK